MKAILILCLTGSLLFLYACSGKNESGQRLVKEPHLQELNLEEPQPEEKKEMESGFIGDTDTSQAQPPLPDKKQAPAPRDAEPGWDKKIIRNASLNLEVKDYHAFSASLREKVRNAGGYLAQEEQAQTDYKLENAVILRVPVDQFDQLISSLTTNVEKLNEKKISSEDVTAEFFDTRSRMEAKRQVRQRYIELLKQARNMEEILNVQSQINGIQEEIESAAGRIRYLGHSSAYSTIHLVYYQVLNAAAQDSEKPSFGAKLSQAFRSGGSWLVDLCIGLVSVWPLFLLGFGAWLLYRKMRPHPVRQKE